MSAPDLWNAIDDGVALVDGDGVVCNVNRPFAAIFGTSTDKLIGVPVENLVHDSTRRRHIGDRNRFTEAPIRRAMAGLVNLEGRRVDGSSVAVRIALTPVEIDDVGYTLVAVRDVSDKVVIEHRLASARRMIGENAKADLERAELHDATIQRLFAIGIDLQAHHERLKDDGADSGVDRIVVELDEMIEQLRLVVAQSLTTTSVSGQHSDAMRE